MLQLGTRELAPAKPMAYSTALIIIPGSVNYFYNVEGRRIAEALRELGCEVSVCTLDSYEPRSYDWCFLFNVYEINHAYGNYRGFLQHMRDLKASCKRVFPVLLEALQTKWYQDSLQLVLESKLENILDIGFHDQRDRLKGLAPHSYRFCFNGLTRSEKESLSAAMTPASERPIPWTLVGQGTSERVSMVDELIRNYDSRGFVYLVRHVPYTEDGPHIKEAQFHSVLQRTRFKIWCSHHPYPYAESIRFRLALMAGCVPIKVNMEPQFDLTKLPFSSLILNKSDFVKELQDLNFEEARERFVEEFCALPSFEEVLHRLLQEEPRRD